MVTKAKNQAIITKRAKQAIWLKTYQRTFGNITASCQAAGISRIIYYEKWKKKDKVFIKRLEIARQAMEDASREYLEAQAYNLIENGDKRMLELALRCKAGWSEKQSAAPPQSNITIHIEGADED